VTAYKLDELARAADVAPRTVRYYVQRGLLPAPEFRGKDTTYGPEHLLRLRAIKHLQKAHLPLDEIQARILAASPAELERLASATTVNLPLPAPAPAPAPRPAPARERWERVELVPGVELHVKVGAGDEARRVAAEILATYGCPASHREE
jgi:DNA-binding transcriptional MerR regulator